jgi:hypothetical protein
VSDDNDPVGSVAEEAAKLFAALQGWAKESGEESAATATGAAQGASALFREISDHVATDGADCRYCPLCQFISTVRQMTPEVKHHLTAATTSLMQALAAALASDSQRAGRRPTNSPVEKIDLFDDSDWDDEE